MLLLFFIEKDSNKYNFDNDKFKFSYLYLNFCKDEHINSDKSIKLIDRNQVILLIAGTGTGKTVITPRAALQYFNFQKKICVSVPKIKLTVEHAEYTSICFDTVVGNEIGYQSSKANKTNKNTKLTFITAGSLKSIIVNKDPLLSEYSCVIIDEAHERSVDIDQLFLLMKLNNKHN